MRRVRCAIIDEAHCIKYWGESFRKDFDELGKLRSYLTNTTPFLIASATLTPALLDETLDKLEYNRNKMFKINLGNDRPNITPIVGTLPGGENDLKALASLALRPNEQTGELEQSIVYVNTRDAAQEMADYLQSQLPAEQRDQVDFLHSYRHPLTKRRVMRLFREGKIKILVSTEVAGMVSTFTDELCHINLAYITGNGRLEYPTCRTIQDHELPRRMDAALRSCWAGWETGRGDSSCREVRVPDGQEARAEKEIQESKESKEGTGRRRT